MIGTMGDGLVVRCAAEVEPREIEWLWPGRVAIGKQTIVAGEPGLGKSQLSAALVAAVTTGGSWPNEEGHAPLGRAIVLSAEDDAADTMIPRLIAAGADLARVHIISAVRLTGGGRRVFSLQTDLCLLEREIERVGDVRLVIIDPVSSYLGRSDSNNSADVRAVLAPIGEMASRLRVAVVSITHFSKSGSGSAINRFAGSIAFVAAARAAFVVARDPDDSGRRLFVPCKNNLGPDGEGLGFRLEARDVGGGIMAPAVSWDGLPVARTADEVLRAVQGGGGRPARDAAKAFLAAALAAGPAAVGDLEARARARGLLGASTLLSHCRAMRAAADSLGVVKRREGFGPGSVVRWSLPTRARPPIGAHACPGAEMTSMDKYEESPTRRLAQEIARMAQARSGQPAAPNEEEPAVEVIRRRLREYGVQTP
jgi:hypothetical protein